MDNDQISGRSPPRQETISLADVALQRGHSSAEPNTARDNEYTSGIISYISIPYDQQSQLSDTVDISSSTSEKEETIESDDDDEWREIHELLFKSVGFERVQECLQKVQEKRGESWLVDSDQMSELPPLSSPFKDELIRVYFRQFHPLCPAVDRTQFLRWYHTPDYHRGDHPQLMQLVLLSILFAALTHVDEELLRHGSYSSVQQAQKALFAATQSMYHRLEPSFTGAEALAQCALLLSHWSPYDSTKEVNSYWVDEAIRHAVAGGMSDRSSTHRKRIIWWCCLIRNRMISLGLRRFNRLERRVDGPLPTTMDFCDPASTPYTAPTAAKGYFVRVFTLMCSLSRIMVDSVLLRYRKYNTAWSFPDDRAVAESMDEVGYLQEKLNIWSFNFADLYARVQESIVPHSDLVIFHLIGLMHQFAISILYEPFLRLPDSPGSRAWFVKDFALLKIKEVSTNTAAITASMLRFAKPKDLPITLPPWIILPIALHLVQLSQQQDLEVKTETTQQLGYLMRTLHSLTCRFEGAQFIKKIINAIIMFVGISAGDQPMNQPLRTPGTWQGHAQGFGMRGPRFSQRKVVTHVLEAIRKGLADEDISV